MGALLALLLPLVPALVHGAESIFAKKPASGPDKMSAVMQALRAIITQFIAAKVPIDAAGTILTAQPTDDALQGVIETVLQQLKSNGTLTAPAAPTAPAGNLFIVQGSVTPIKLGQ